MCRTIRTRHRYIPEAVTALALCLCVAGGCQSSQDHPLFSSADPWYRPSPSPGKAESVGAKLREPYDPIDPSLVMLVSESASADAEKRLEDGAWARLTAEEANDLAGWTGAPSHNLFLLRGLDLTGTRGEFRVSQSRAGDVMVSFVSVGAGPAPASLRRQALVAHLGRPPRDVFVTVEPAEGRAAARP